MTTPHPVKTPRKLIEVALPLDAINAACAYEKMPGIGAHPRGLHLWWARRPLAAARAVIFGQMVNDPSWKWELEHPEEIPPNNLKASWAASRKRLFSILEDLVKWEHSTNEEVAERARVEIRKSWREACDLNKDHPQYLRYNNFHTYTCRKESFLQDPHQQRHNHRYFRLFHLYHLSLRSYLVHQPK